MVNLTDKQKAILEAQGHLLVVGGPGSGKTTIAILKAAKLTAELKPGQSALFLSFARATVTRILEAMDEEKALTNAEKKRIDVDTYHAFFWRILKTHGYLVGLPRKLEIVTPPNEAIALSSIRRTYPSARKQTQHQKSEREAKEQAERLRLAEKEGRVCFSLFAHYVSVLLSRSSKVRRLIVEAFPVVILDEFQDTTADQWKTVKALGDGGKLIALADPEQRIFEFAGAEEKRLQQYRDTFKPDEFDLKGDNHRSKGTDIVIFGNDILAAKYTQSNYVGVHYGVFASNTNQAFAALHGQALQARSRLIESGRKHWTLGVLVPTKKFTRLVSDRFRDRYSGMASINHHAAVDMEGPVLAAEFLAFLLQQVPGPEGHRKAVDLMCSYYRGCGGDTLTVQNTKEADAIAKALDRHYERVSAGKSSPKGIFKAINEALILVENLTLTGDPDADWLAVRKVLEESDCQRLKELASEVRNVRLLERGTQLRQALSADWRQSGGYPNALEITRQAFVQEHFATAGRPERGVVVMNMHKSKGKQFDEVIIFEGWPRMKGNQIMGNPDRIVRSNEPAYNTAQARQNFRVSITRAKVRLTILTPKADPCILLTSPTKAPAG